MNEKRDGGQAFPRAGSQTHYADGTSDGGPGTPGMSLRDYFAAKALAIPDLVAANKVSDAATEVGMTSDEYTANGYQGYRALLAKCAYRMADAMLKAREQ